MAVKICTKCVLPETFPGISFDEERRCCFCSRYKGRKNQDKIKKRFKQKSYHVLKDTKGKGPYDTLIAYSGGKDSTYTLRLLKETFDLRILAITFDHGFVSPTALENIRKVTDNLDVDHLCVRPGAKTIRELFVKSMASNIYPVKAMERASITQYLENVEQDIILNVLPLSFDYGLYQVLMAFLFGGTVVLEKSFAYPYEIIEHLTQERVTGLPIVPTMAAILFQMKNLSRFEFSSLRYITNTADALSAVIGVPDEFFGQSIKAFIVKNKKSKLTEKEVMKYCVRNLEPFMLPKYIEFHDSFPKSANGKIDKKKLS